MEQVMLAFPFSCREYVEQHSEISPICIYMRDEVTGKTALEKTSLKSLGLTGGNAIIRVVTKKAATSSDTTQIKSNESISKELIAKPSSTEEPKSTSVSHTVTFPTSAVPSNEPEFANQCDDKKKWSKEFQDDIVERHSPSEPVPSSFVPFVGSGQRLGGGGSPKAVVSPVSDVPVSILPASLSSPSGPSKPKKSKNSQEKLKEQKEVVFALLMMCTGLELSSH